MDFWGNVEKELSFQNKTKKELAILTGIKEQTLHKAFERKSTPSAESALKISYVLNVSLEYLLDLPEKSSSQNLMQMQKEVQMYRKYSELIEQAQRLSDRQLKALVQLIDTM